MTAVDQRGDKDTAAAVGFMAILALCAGGAGVIIAALAVGCERAWANWRGTRGSGGGWTRHLDDQQAWLAADRKRLADWRKKRRDWWADGADPQTEPERPPLSSGRGAWARRAWATVAVFADRVRSAAEAFRDGVRAGWKFARKVRDEGGTWWETAGSRPDEHDEDDWDDAPDTGWFDGEQPASSPNREQQREAGPRTAPEPEPADPSASQPDPNPNPSTEGEPVTTSTQGETNLDCTAADLAGIQAELAAIEEHNDALAARRAALQARLATASERVESTGGTTATAQALDAARAVVDQLGQHLAGVSDSTVEASDVTQAAHAGLAPARDAQDALQAAGARGEFIDTATNG